MLKILIFYTYNIIQNFYQVAKLLRTSVGYIWREIMKVSKNPDKIARKIAEMEAVLRFAVGDEEADRLLEKHKQELKKEIFNEVRERKLPIRLEKEDEAKVLAILEQGKKKKENTSMEKVSRDDLYFLRKFFYERAGVKESIAPEAEYALLKKLLLKNTREDIKLAMTLYIDAEKYKKYFSLKNFCAFFHNYYIPREKIAETLEVLHDANQMLGTNFVGSANNILRLRKVLDRFGRDNYLKAIQNLKRKIYDTRNSPKPFTTASIRIDLLLDEQFIDNLLNYKPQQNISNDADKIETEMIKKQWGLA